MVWFWIIFFLWCLSGITGVWVWWSETLDLTLGIAIWMGCLGAPCGFVWWIIVGWKAWKRWHNNKPRKYREPIVILKARHPDEW